MNPMASGPSDRCCQTDAKRLDSHQDGPFKSPTDNDDDVEFLRIAHIAEAVNASRAPIETVKLVAGGMQPAQILQHNNEELTAVNLRSVKRLAKYWNNIQDYIYPISTWPLRNQFWFLMVHKRHLTRVNCATFLLGNGVPPDVVYDHVMCIWDGSELVHADYDASARYDVTNVIKHHKKELRTGKYTYFDLVTRRVQSWA